MLGAVVRTLNAWHLLKSFTFRQKWVEILPCENDICKCVNDCRALEAVSNQGPCTVLRFSHVQH